MGHIFSKSNILRLLSFIFITVVMVGCSTTKPVTEADIIKHNIAAKLLNERQFMVKGNRLVLPKQTIPSVSSSTNFVVVDGDDATVQVSPGLGGGPNGVGGFTVKGTISGYEVKNKSNGDVNVKYYVMANGGSCTVYINLPKNGTNATVTISSTFKGRNATLYGNVTEIDNSIFVGRSR